MFRGENMRKFFVILVLIIIILVIFGVKYLVKDKNVVYEDITMEVLPETITDVSLTVKITDLSGLDNTYDEWYRIDKLVAGKWQELEKIAEIKWRDISYKISDKNMLHLDIFFEELYGALDKGEYRVVKKVNDDYLMASFVI